MAGITILIIIGIYFCILYLISYFTSKKGSDNETFFMANRKSTWWIVAIGMVGTSISGVTFVSVPGMVVSQDMSYMQMVLGFFFGYLIISSVLLPLYYKLKLTTIYGYLEQRLGFWSYKTGAAFFIISKITGAAARLYLVILILQNLVFSQWNIPFFFTVSVVIFLIWLYTHKSGIKTIIWTDTLQTICFIAALILIIWQLMTILDIDLKTTFDTIRNSEHSRIFIFDDWGSKQNFFKQFFSGIFITIVMTGLDQDMMQKNLTCRNLKEAKKNMNIYGFAFIPINFLFLCLGILLITFMIQQNITIPQKTDEILPLLASQYLGLPVLIFFIIGIVGAAFSSADSALAALTTSVSIDFLNIQRVDKRNAKKIREKVHILICIIFGLIILGINVLNRTNVLDAIYTIASYTYGPLLGMFCFGLFTHRKVIKDAYVPYLCVASPLFCFILATLLQSFFNYKMGYELLMLNGLITFIGLLCISKKRLLNNKNIT